ncbi:MAG: O-antigen ligase family protein [Ruminococcaceae bacterium]|nr:O-antigen ligase family protein [Oscillospiraceae bacterium]
MKNKLKNGLSFALDPFFVQVYFLLFSFLSELPLIMAHVQLWKKVGLVWAAAAIVWDVLTTRRILKTRFALPIAGLLAAYGVTVGIVAFAYPAAWYETALNWVCSFATLWVLYPPVTGDKEQGLRRLSGINRLLIVLTTAAAAVGIGMFLTGYGEYFYSSITEYNYPQGFVDGRLTGVYRNAIYPTAFIGFAAAVAEWVRLQGKRWGARTVLLLSMLLNVLHVVLSNSRSLTLALALFTALTAVLVLRGRLPGGAVLRWSVGVTAAVAVAAAVMLLTPYVRRGCAYLPQYFTPAVSDTTPTAPDTDMPDTDAPSGEGDEQTPPSVKPTPDNQAKPNQGPVNVDRENPHGTLTGRPVIWKQGIEAFLKRPLFGHGPFALKDSIRLSETSGEKLSHFHNVFLQSFVSVGVVGSVFFFLLIFGAAFVLLRWLFKNRTHPQYTILSVLSSFLATMVFINMADTTLFFLSKNSEFVFWTYLGFAVMLTEDAPYRLDAPMRALDRLFSRKETA